MFAPERYRPIKTLALFSVSVMGACGKNPTGPSAPPPSGSPNPPARVVRQSCVLPMESISAIRVGLSPDETSTYAVEIGSSPGATTRTVLTGDNGDFGSSRISDPGETFARVRARLANGELSGPSNEVRFLVVDIRDLVRALFPGGGPSPVEGRRCSGLELCDTSACSVFLGVPLFGRAHGRVSTVQTWTRFGPPCCKRRKRPVERSPPRSR